MKAVTSEGVSRSPGAFVSPRGTTRRRVIGEVGGGLVGLGVGIAIAAVFGLFDGWAVAFATGIAGALAGAWLENKFVSHDRDASPMKEEELGYLAVLPESIVLFTARQGGLRPKRTESVLATMPRAAVKYARMLNRRILEIAFGDGSSWMFDVRKSKEIRQVISALASSPNRPASPAPGWYRDPRNHYELRYWDGSAWTHHVSSGGRASLDPN